MHLTTGIISQLVGGVLEGNPDVPVLRPEALDKASPGGISFFYDPKYESYLYSTGCAAIVVPGDYQPSGSITPALIRVKNPYQAFNQILATYFTPAHPGPGREEPCFISPEAQVSPLAYVGAFAYIGPGAVVQDGAKIYPGVYIGPYAQVGADAVIYPGAVVYREVQIGSRCILQAGSIVGSDGFGYLPLNGRYEKIPHLGQVILQDDVEVGSNSTIDRATLGATLLKQGVKVDNLVQIAHNVEIGEHTGIAAQAGISGSAKLGAYCRIGGQVGLVGHITVDDGTNITAQSGVSKSLKGKGKTYRGAPARELTKQLKLEAYQNMIPELVERIKNLESELARVKEQLGR